MKVFAVAVEYTDIKTLRDDLNKVCDDLEKRGVYPFCLANVDGLKFEYKVFRSDVVTVDDLVD